MPADEDTGEWVRGTEGFWGQEEREGGGEKGALEVADEQEEGKPNHIQLESSGMAISSILIFIFRYFCSVLWIYSSLLLGLLIIALAPFFPNPMRDHPL